MLIVKYYSYEGELKFSCRNKQESYMTFTLLAVRNQIPKYQLLFSAMDPGSLPQKKWAPTSADNVSPLSISMA